ncbi:hypothetical protein JYU34_001607 [Plutella xylostella]|uniref:Uncharacterized protein n=1 Tax=Plutella xylostella TaxID=51655 RepID=A0ABQ7R4C0_PLUXY|nr:hypothetical protein JYU34_001607 [Plutella xylostella]
MEPRAVKMEWEKRRECGLALCELVIAGKGDGTSAWRTSEREREHIAVYKKTQDVGRVWRMGVWVVG